MFSPIQKVRAMVPQSTDALVVTLKSPSAYKRRAFKKLYGYETNRNYAFWTRKTAYCGMDRTSNENVYLMRNNPKKHHAVFEARMLLRKNGYHDILIDLIFVLFYCRLLQLWTFAIRLWGECKNVNIRDTEKNFSSRNRIGKYFLIASALMKSIIRRLQQSHICTVRVEVLIFQRGDDWNGRFTTNP